MTEEDEYGICEAFVWIVRSIDGVWCVGESVWRTSLLLLSTPAMLFLASPIIRGSAWKARKEERCSPNTALPTLPLRSYLFHVAKREMG